MSRENVKISIAYFGDYPSDFTPDKYDLLFESAEFADTNGFEALWIPERHFDSFGGFSPNPSLIASALARHTKRIKLRAGSVVLPLHDPIRVAEEWSMVDNFSLGRVGIAFAPGWHPNDFVLTNNSFSDRKNIMHASISDVCNLWRGKSITRLNGNGEETTVSIYPKPLQNELPIWLAVLGNPDSYRKAGEIGAGILTNLIGQNIDDLKNGINIYKDSLMRNGFKESDAHVTVLLHSFIDIDKNFARDKAKEPLKSYLSSSLQLFQKTQLGKSNKVSIDSLPEEEQDYIYERAYRRYAENNALIGDVESCSNIIKQLENAGVSEVAAFIDFGLQKEEILKSLKYISELKDRQYIEPSTSFVEPAVNAEKPLKKLKKVYNTSEDQYSLWMLASMRKEGSLAYHLRTTLSVCGTLDLALLQKAVDSLVERHEALRTTFSKDGKHQIVHRDLKNHVFVFDFSDHDESARRKKIEEWFLHEEGASYNLEKGPLWRVSVIKEQENKYLLVISIHHIICDGISKGILLEELGKLYTSKIVDAHECQLSDVVHFKEFLEDREKSLTEDSLEAHENFWREKYSDGPPVLNLPVKNTYPALRNYNGNRLKYSIEKETWKKVLRASAQSKCTPYMFMLSIWSLFLHKISGQHDLIVGVPAGNRTSVNGVSMIGYSFNLLPIRSLFGSGLTFEDFLKNTKNNLLEGFEHYEYPFVKLLELFDAHDWSRSPLVASSFNMDKLPIPVFADNKVDYAPQPSHFVRFDLSFNINLTVNDVIFYWEYNSDLFEKGTIEKFHAYLMRMLDSLIDDPHQLISDLTLEDHYNSSTQIKNVDSKEVSVSSFLDQFECHVKKTPDCIAASDTKCKFTYKELDVLSNAIAQDISKNKIDNQVIGIYLENSAYTIASILAIWKSGNAFLGITDSLPLSRISEICNLSKVPLILTEKGKENQIGDLSLPFIRVDDASHTKKSARKLKKIEAPEQSLAYVVFTSGSTGTPKGVKVTHLQLSHYLDGVNNKIHFSKNKNYLFLSPLNVDLGYTTLFSSLYNGGTLHFMDVESSKDPGSFCEFLKEREIDYLKITPSHFQALTYKLSDLREYCPKDALIFGGEVLTQKLASEVQKHCRVINHYGPSETTIGVFSHEYEGIASSDSEYLPIGTPFTGVEYMVIDQWSCPVPEEIRGELLIGGPQVTKGYIGDVAENESLFVEIDSQRYYKTGDIVKTLKDGSVQFLSRIDNQVKINGYRIELGEVKSAINSIEGVNDAEVVISSINETNNLCAFVLSDNLVPEFLLGQLRKSLPQYMVPHKIIVTQSLPRLSSGKVDIEALKIQAMNDNHVRIKSVDKNENITEKEKEIISLWKEILNCENISVNDDFFDLGGTSIHAIKLCQSIAQNYSCDLTILHLFDYSTPKQLANFITSENTKIAS